MKYLIQNKKEFVISLGVFLTILLVIFWAIWSITHGSFDYKNLIAIVGVIFEALGWYYNMPTSEANCKYTGRMRLEKAQLAGKIDGENFYDEFEEEPLEDEEYEEEQE